MQLLLDPAQADVRVDFGVAEAEFAQRTQSRASAELFRAIDEVVREAESNPEVFLGFSRLRGRDAIEFAVRAAVADLATRVNLAEATVRAYGLTARALRERLPDTWAYFREGEISAANAREAANIALELPTEVWAQFDEQVRALATTLAPARFRATARALRERLHTESLTARHERGLLTRGVWAEVDRDGMGWLHVKLSAERLATARAHLDARAFELLRSDDETRTMAHLRADVAGDLLSGSIGSGGAGVSGGATVAVALSVPVLSLLGRSDELPVLEGVGPIDIETARRLCGAATSFTRILTDPITGTVLTMDARTYRPTAALKRWLGLRDVTCTFPGCGRDARSCDLDHTIAWAAGGTTTADNLAHLCRKHHRMKHETKWRVERPPGEQPRWTSPTGHEKYSDPPPY